MGGKPDERPILDAWIATTVANQRVKLCDGQRLPQQARACVIGWKPPDWKQWQGTSPIDALIDLQLMGGGLIYRRLFQLGQYRSVEIPVAAYSQMTVFVNCPQSGWEMRAFASSEAANEARHEPVVYVQELTGTLERAVPFGAKSVTAAVNDGAWTWRAYSGGVAVPITNALTGGTPATVKGTTFQNSVSPLAISWEIDL